MATPCFNQSALNRALLQFREAFKDKLTPEMHEEFRITHRQHLDQAIQKIQKQQRSERKLQNSTRLRAFLEAMESYSAVISIFANVSEFVPFIWGPMKWLLEMANNHIHAFDKLLDTYEEIGRALPLLHQYEELFRESSHVYIALVNVYQEILEFHWEAIRCFRKHMWWKLFDAAWKTFQTRVGPCMKRLAANRRLLEQTADLDHFKEFRQSRREEMARLDLMLRHEQERRRKEVFQWLGDANPASVYHQDLCQVRAASPKCGQWLFDKEDFQRWFTPDLCLSPLLWMNGKPGAGKTVLASLVIEKCQQTIDFRVIYFYCKQSDDSRDTFASLACAVIWQVFRQDPSLADYLFENCSSRGHPTNLKSDEESCFELARVILQCPEKVYIVIDGLDECKEHEQEKIIKFFCSLIDGIPKERSDSLRCMLIGQNDNTSKKLLAQRPKLRIRDEDNIEDIAAFAYRESKNVQGLTPERADRLANDVKNYSRGMFLYAKLVMENLTNLWSEEEVEQELQDATFPRGIDQAYNRILERMVRGPHPKQRERVLDILGIIATATRPLKWREVQGALAIDLEKQEINFLKRRISKMPKEICSSLVEERANGNVELVHATAREYLFTLPEINRVGQDIKLSKLCLTLLADSGFDSINCGSDQALEDRLRSGHYAFLDYAVSSWWHHTNRCIQRGEDKSALKSLRYTLDAFLDVHYQATPGGKRMNNRLRSDLKEKMGSWESCDRLNHAITATRYQVRSNGPNSDQNEALDVPQMLQRVRSVMELVARAPRIPEDRTGRTLDLSTLYGFDNYDRRQAHIDKHEKPFQCTYPACPHADIGFANKSQLSTHLKTQHGQHTWDDEEFPPRRKLMVADDDDQDADIQEKFHPSKFICDICGQNFTRSVNLDGHKNSHKGEKPHKCSFCGLAFARSNDCRRHENLHSEKRKHVCTGKLGEQMYGGETWGCNKEFRRGHKLVAHYVYEDESSGVPACIQPLIQQVHDPNLGGANGKYVCQGKLKSARETIEWGCKTEFNTVKQLKKHWKHYKGRTCLKEILKGREEPPASELELEEETQDGTAAADPGTAGNETSQLVDPNLQLPPMTQPTTYGTLPSFDQVFGNIGTHDFNFGNDASALEGFDFDSFLPTDGYDQWTDQF